VFPVNSFIICHCINENRNGSRNKDMPYAFFYRTKRDRFLIEKVLIKIKSIAMVLLYKKVYESQHINVTPQMNNICDSSALNMQASYHV